MHVRACVPTPVPLAAARRDPRRAKGVPQVGAAPKPGRARRGPAGTGLVLTLAGRGDPGIALVLAAAVTTSAKVAPGLAVTAP